MSGFLVMLIQRKVLVRGKRPTLRCDQIAMPSQSTLLTAAGSKISHLYPNGGACLTVVAVGSVNELATAAKPILHKLGVGLGVQQTAGHGHLRARDPTWHVTARVNRRHIKLNFFRFKNRPVGHCVSLVVNHKIPVYR